MARIQGEGDDSEDNFIRFAHLVIEESLTHTVTGIRNFLRKCVINKVGVYSMLKLSEVNHAAKEIVIINEDVAEYLRRQIRKMKSFLEPDWPTYNELDSDVLSVFYNGYEGETETERAGEAENG
jgi:hypothetical protein